MKKEIIKNCFIAMMIIIIIIGLVFLIKGEEKVQNEVVSNLEDEEEAINKDIFEGFYEKANEILEGLSEEEKIGQLFLVRYPNENSVEILEKYKFGGYILFEKDFKGKTEEEVKSEIKELQEASKIPLLIAVDEEGGKVVRVSSNRNLVSEKFKSPSELYNIGGFDKIKEDTILKSNVLYNLGINLNLAPVVDISENKSDYIYERTLGKDKELTGIYAKTVIKASKEGKVSYTLKHFPGYGSNVDTHTGIAIDNKTYEEIKNNDLVSFIQGINAGAEAVMVSHNKVNSIDAENPASLSKKVHDILRDELGFTGIIMTDDLDMGAVSNDQEAVIKAVQAGNDLTIITDYEASIQTIKKGMEEEKITKEMINEKVRKVLAWKCYKGMI